jgi:outer membrane receptor protein involved in Fe transport
MKFRALRNSCALWSITLAIVLATTMCALFPATASAQVGTAINGTVHDASGAVIPDANVVLHNPETKLDLVTTTNSAGAYGFPAVQPGTYDIKVSKEGFEAAVESGVTAVVNQIATVDVTLKTGAVSETVTVQATTNEVETTSSELGVAIVRTEVNDLPLNGRNFTQLLNLTPGVSTVNVSQNSATSGGVWSNPIGTFSYPSVNGQSNRSNLFLLDGVNNQGSFGSTYAVAPIVDDIQEFKVQSHNDDASFGGVMGGIVNVITKSGTTAYHGTLWEFLRNTALDARDPFLTAVTPFQQNQFGAAAGGPIDNPWHHSSNPKTFFFVSYEGFRNHTTSQNFYNTPTPAELGGDLTGIAGQIYNPYSVVPDAATKTGFTNAPFMCDSAGNPLPAVNNIQAAGIPCNKIPANMLSTPMVTYAKTIFPAPINTGNPLYNGLDTTKAIIHQDVYSARLDHQFSVNDNVFARFTQFRQPDTGSGGFEGLFHTQVTDGYNVAVGYTHSFSGGALLVLNFGRVSLNIDQGSTNVGVPTSFAQTVGYSPNFASNFIGGVSMIPEVVIDGYIGNPDPSAHGAAQIDDTHVSDIWQWGGDYTKIRGHHTLKFGANFAGNNAGALYLNSSEIFSSSNTASAAGLPGQTGNALASFLLGIPNNASRRDVIETEHGGWIDGFYAMDSWKVTSRLTVNFGLRYDFTLMPIYGDDKDKNNEVGDMDLFNGTYILAHSAPSCDVTHAAPCIPPQPAGSPCAGAALPCNVVVTPFSNGAIYHNDFTNWQPRVGVAYSLFQNTVLRAGYGRFYDNWAAITQTAQNFEGTWPSVGQLGASNLNPLTGTPNTGVLDPFNLGSGQALPAATPFSQSTWFADPYLKRPYADQWNFGVEQQVTSRTVLSANYVGSRGEKLDIGGAYNVATTPGPGNPQLRAPFPYIGVTAFDRSVGSSTYNALQMSLNGRSEHGLTYLVSYTWSKSIDLGCSGWYGVEGCSIQNPYDIRNDKGPSATDVPQIFSAAFVYQLPFGKGQRWAASDNKALDYFVGGWALNGVLSFNSGTPFDVGTGQDIANTGNYNYGNGYGYERANVSGPLYPSDKTTAEWFNRASFTYPAPFTFGDLGRDTLRSDWYKNLDLSIFKELPITESKRFEFRAEMFNATNTPVWAVPDTSLDAPCIPKNPNNAAAGCTPTFGSISSTANVARQIQFGLKFYF